MKRFYQDAAAVEIDGGYGVALDGRNIRTPAKAVLVAPTRALAEAIAKEWAAQVDKVDPATMPFMKFASTAIDRIRPQRDAVTGQIAAYAQTDLICYRAEGPLDLVQLQEESWQPLLDWCNERHGASLRATKGVIPIDQDSASLAALSAAVCEHDDFALSALHGLTSTSGSLVIGLAVTAGHLNAAGAVDAAQIDETFQADKWGYDKDAADALSGRRHEIESATTFYALLEKIVINRNHQR
jgi:chaperone required for assembly of F1-ATPase